MPTISQDMPICAHDNDNYMNDDNGTVDYFTPCACVWSLVKAYCQKFGHLLLGFGIGWYCYG